MRPYPQAMLPVLYSLFHRWLFLMHATVICQYACLRHLFMRVDRATVLTVSRWAKAQQLFNLILVIVQLLVLVKLGVRLGLFLIIHVLVED